MYQGENIRKIREYKKITGKRLAELAGYAPSYISELENNKTTPSILTLENVAKALDVPLSVIMDDEYYYPYLSGEGLKVSDSKLSLYNDTFTTLQKYWLDVVENWEINDVEELIIYLKTKKEHMMKRKSK